MIGTNDHLMQNLTNGNGQLDVEALISFIVFYLKVNLARGTTIDTCAGCIIIIIIMMQDQLEYASSRTHIIEHVQYSNNTTTEH